MIELPAQYMSYVIKQGIIFAFLFISQSFPFSEGEVSGSESCSEVSRDPVGDQRSCQQEVRH